MSEEQPKTKSMSLMNPQVVFLFNGITSLLGWNAVLSSMDYFQYVYKDHNVYSIFPVPLFIGYAIIGVLFNILSKKYAYRILVPLGIIIVNLSLMMLLLFSFIFQDSPDLGFWLSLILCFLLGIGGNVTQLSFFSMINYLSAQVVSKFTIGTALSGLFVNVIRMIILSIAGDNQSNIIPIITYFVIAVMFNAFDLILNVNFMKRDVYIQAIAKNQPNFKQPEKLIDSQLSGEVQEAKQYQKSYLTNMIETGKVIFPYNLFLLLNYIITFMIFPGPTIKKTFDWSSVWSSQVFITCYNVGDTVGKYIAGNRKTFNPQSVTYALLSRLYFFISITLIATVNNDYLLSNNVFPFFNQLLVGITNGFLTNACFILCFEKAPQEYKKYAGVMGGLCLQFGIVLGTILEIPYEDIFID